MEESWERPDHLDLGILRLREALVQAALPADEQISRLRGCDASYEVASDFGHWCRWALGSTRLHLADDQRSRLRSLDDRFDRMSGAHNAALWTDEALRTNSAWDAVRQEALKLLQLLPCPIEGRLQDSLRQAALSASQQVAGHTGLATPLEIAAYLRPWARAGVDLLQLSDSQREILARLHQRVEAMIHDPEGDLMKVDSLYSSPEWESVRQEARKLLELMGWRDANSMI